MAGPEALACARFPPAPWRAELLQVAVVLGVAVYVDNAGYGFEGTGRLLGRFDFTSRALGGPEVSLDQAPRRANRFRNTWMAMVPVPLPANYVMGIDVQRRDFERGMPSYLRGQWRPHGWWYYYLYAMAVKMPVGTLMLLGAGLVLALARKAYAPCWRSEMAVLAPAAAVLLLVSSQTGFNAHMRYVLPAFPFLYVWASKVARAVYQGQRALAAGATVAAACTVCSSLWVYPHSLSYFNELAGGPREGHWHLVDSNIDWGQDLLYLARWADRHPEARPLRVAYFGVFPVTALGLEEWNGAAWGPAWYAISVHRLRDSRALIALSRALEAVLLHRQPVATAGYSIYIYHITPEDADRVRQALGLFPPPARPAVASHHAARN